MKKNEKVATLNAKFRTIEHEAACKRQTSIAKDAFVRFNIALSNIEPKNLDEPYADSLVDSVSRYFDLLVAMWRGEQKFFNEDETRWLKPISELYEELGDGDITLTDEQAEYRTNHLCGLYEYYLDNDCFLDEMDY